MRCHTVVFLIQQAVVVACVIFTHGFSRCRGYWIGVFCCLFVVRIYMHIYIYICSVGYTERPVVPLYLPGASMVYHMLSKTRRSSGSLNRVIGKVLVLGLLVVVYKIPYSSCMFNTAFVLVRQGVPIILLSIWYNVYACHSQVPGISLHHCYCCLPGTTYHSSLCGGYVITELVSL